MAPSIVCGAVLFQTPPEDVRRLAHSVSVAADAIEIDCRFAAIDNSGQETPDAFAGAGGGLLPCELHPHDGNLGFAGAHNRLMQQAFAGGASHYLALDPGGFLHPEALKALLTCARIFKNFALLEARQFPNEHPKTYNVQTFETPWCSRACLMIPKRLYKKIGGFDDGFFVYCEDVDLSWRTRLAGASCVTVPEAFFFHDVIDRPQSDFSRWHMALSMKRLMSKWMTGIASLRLSTALAEMLFDAPEEALALGSKPGKPIRNAASADIADFRHFFGFAPFRWT